MAQDPAALIAEAQRGDRAAFDDLVRVFHRGVFGYARRVLRDEQRAVEVTQETFVRAWRYRGSFDPSRGSVRGWLFAIAANRLRDARIPRKTAAVSLDDVPEQTTGESSGLEAYARKVAHAELLTALDGLEPEQREVMTLRYLSNLSYPEVATALGISPGAARMRALRGREQLAQRLLESSRSSESSESNERRQASR